MDYCQFLNMPQELGLLLVFLLVFLYDLFLPKKAQSGLAAFTAVVFAIFTIAAPFMTAAPAFSGMFEGNTATSAVKCVLNIGMLIVLVQSVKWANSEFITVRRGEFYSLLLVTLLGMYFMVSARHFLLFIIGLEMASLPIAALVAFDKRRYESHEAAAKYLFTAIFSSAVLLMGLSFVYALSGSLYFDDIAYCVIGDTSALLIVALAFVIAGIGFKLSLVPFHLWTADVYQGAPTSVTSYLSVISKGAAAFSFLVVLSQAFGAVYSQVWEWMLYALIILTITIGNLFAIRQTNLKRFLAFSSISQAGYIVLGVIACSALGMTSLMFYVLVYIFSNLAAFGVIQAIENNCGKVNIDDYNGLYKTNPMLSVAMMLAMFSLAGIPPFAGFFSKFFIFTSALQAGTVSMYVLVLIALINTIVSLYYYLLVVKAMFIHQDDCVIAPFKSALSERIALLVCVIGIILIGIVPFFYTFLEAASVLA
ncbi:MAG: NADH-quinone oxidoreductase subunit N [Muribaculaceae bacterium]|nr:NADH-quinone oxidoreductase subunit N [Bacteroidales bacterium]MDY4880791.1 NADH-quinone oxidoreductase subunit N [Muribaculaceae bacterium]